ncbi:glycosyltransferase family 25 protein [Hoeflea sp.]|uniref:glycosyltransferase family 25 protein n=1 Tax=Hoeflea sp. TaxID=1940281 RepID=UPI003B01E424
MSEFLSPAYLINLDRNPERLKTSGEALNSIGMKFQRFTGVDYREMDTQSMHSAVHTSPNARIKRNLSPGEIACFLSHVEVWRTIAEGRADMAWVFEDDISFCENAREVMLEIESGARNWDLVRLYSHKALSLEQAKPLIAGYSIALSRKIPMSTIGYAISRPAAEYLSKTMVPFSVPVDSALKQWWVHGLCTRTVSPSLCEPRRDNATSSTLEGDRKSHKSRNPLDRFLSNLRYQIHLRHMRQSNAAIFPVERKFDW